MSVRVIGVGNALRGDDGAGPAVARALVGRGVDALEHAGDGVSLIDRWDGAGRVVLVDAMSAGLVPGTVRVFEAGLEPLPAGGFVRSTHRLGVAEGIDPARAAQRVPKFNAGGLLIVRAGGKGGLMSAVIGGWSAARRPDQVRPVTVEIGATKHA